MSIWLLLMTFWLNFVSCDTDLAKKEFARMPWVMWHVIHCQELEAWAWIDHRTRAVILEYTTLNINVNVMVHNRLLFEIPPTGGVSTKYEVRWCMGRYRPREFGPLFGGSATYTWCSGISSKHLMTRGQSGRLKLRIDLLDLKNENWTRMRSPQGTKPAN